MSVTNPYARWVTCLSLLFAMGACGDGSASDAEAGSVVVIPGSTLGQDCTASADCSSELACMSTPEGRVCVQTCQTASDCEEEGARCAPVAGVDIGWCDTSTPAMDEPPVEEPTDEEPNEPPPVGEPPEDEPELRDGYPEGPFGTSVGDIIENHAMLDTNGEAVSLGDLRSDPSVNTLLLFNTVTYCRGCALKTADLTAIHNELGASGILPVVTLYENNDRAATDGRDAYRYQEANGLAFPVTADNEAGFLNYFAERAHPMIILIDAESMTIVYKEASWQKDEVEALVRERAQSE